MESPPRPIQAPIRIELPARAEPLLQTAAAELARDLERLIRLKVKICEALSTSRSEGTLFRLQVRPSDKGVLSGPEAYTIHTSLDDGGVIIEIRGADAMGCLFGVYRYSELALGIDPWEYFTGKEPATGIRTLPDVQLEQSAPAFRYRLFTDDDSDELANFKGEKLHIDFDVWCGAIDSFLRAGFNGLVLLDSLGRGEFWLDDEIFSRHYREICPSYERRYETLERVVEYAHRKGVYVIAHLHWNFPPDPDRLSWPENRDYYESQWRRMLSEGPYRLADAYQYWPQGPLLDSTSPVGDGRPWWKAANEQRRLLKDLISELHPGKPLYYLMWQEWIYEAFLAGKFDIDETDTIVLIPAEAHGAYRSSFANLKVRFPLRFGTMYFPGSWEDHLVQDPRPERIARELRRAAEWGYTEAVWNDAGSSLKNFIFNLDAVSAVCWNPHGFDPAQFAVEWAAGYFGAEPARDIAEVFRLFHAAHEPIQYEGLGGIALLVERGLWLAWGMLPRERVQRAAGLADEALRLARSARPAVRAEALPFYDSYVLQQVQLFCDVAHLSDSMVEFEDELRATAKASDSLAHLPVLKNQADSILRKAEKLYETLENEPWEKWSGWYRRENLRYIGAPPRLEFFKGLPGRVETLLSEKDARSLLADLHERDRLWEAFRTNPRYGRGQT